MRLAEDAVFGNEPFEMEKRLNMNRDCAARALVVALFCASLAACGGGAEPSGGAGAGSGSGGGSGGGAPSNPGSADAPPASLAFVAGSSPRFMMIGLSSQSYGTLGGFSQRKDGALTAMANRSLSGNPTEIRDVGSDPSRAMGSWVQGTVNTSAGSRTLAGDDKDVVHYLAYKTVDRLPAAGSLVCSDALFTTPTYAGSGPASVVLSSAKGAATLTPGVNGVAIRLTLDLAANAGTAKAVFDVTVKEPDSVVESGDVFGTGTSSMVALGDGGDGSYLIAAAYSATVDGGVVYQGMASLRCK